MFLCQSLSHIGMLDIVSFQIKLGDIFLPTRSRPDSLFQNDFIWLWILHKSYSPARVDEFGFLNLLISISEAQDIPVWISSMKVKNPAARRILARVCRDTIARCLKFEDQLQANLKEFFWTKDWIEKVIK